MGAGEEGHGLRSGVRASMARSVAGAGGGGEEGDGLRSVVSGALWRGMAKHMWTPTIASYRVAVIM